MFREIISNLPFSPALVGQLGFYAKRLRKEETTRRLGLIFVILAVIVQSLVVFQPAESVNASNATSASSGSLSLSDNKLLNNNIVKSKTATNVSQGFVGAISTTAFANDQISYTITVENTGLIPASTKLSDNLSDALEYATLIDNGGGTLDKTTKILSWPDVTLSSKSKQTRTFVIRLLEIIPATAKGSTNTSSYDCIMTNSFGNSIDINVDCPTQKIIENVAKELPQIGISENMVFAVIILVLTLFFYARTRQLQSEIRLIRRDISMGTI